MDKRSAAITAVGVALMCAAGVLFFVSFTAGTAGTPGGADAPVENTANVAGQPVPSGFPAADDYARQVFDDTNAARTGQGLQPLARDDCAAAVAAKRVAIILPTGRLEHPPLVTGCGDANTAGENLGHSIYTPSELVDAWMNSAGHRANIVDPNFSVLGVACVASALDDSSRVALAGDAVGGMLCSEIFEGTAP